MIVALCFVLIGTVAAGIPHEPKPDSVVTCSGGLGHQNMHVITHTVQVDSSECSEGVMGNCAPCIRSLENQGCEILDLVTQFIPRDFSELPNRTMQQTAVFQLSCARP